MAETRSLDGLMLGYKQNLFSNDNERHQPKTSSSFEPFSFPSSSSGSQLVFCSLRFLYRWVTCYFRFENRRSMFSSFFQHFFFTNRGYLGKIQGVRCTTCQCFFFRYRIFNFRENHAARQSFRFVARRSRIIILINGGGESVIEILFNSFESPELLRRNCLLCRR